MSKIKLADAKTYLDVIHGADDVKLQMLLDASENEAFEFVNRSGFYDENDNDLEVDPPASFVLGVMLLLQGAYQSTPDDADKLRKAAEIKLMPFRCGLGV
jgi:hypothetical protein